MRALLPLFALLCGCVTHLVEGVRYECNQPGTCPHSLHVEEVLDERRVALEACGADWTEAVDGLELHFSSSDFGAWGRYWPHAHAVEVYYDRSNSEAPDWRGVLAHEMSLAVAEHHLGRVGEAAKIQWYTECAPIPDYGRP